MPKQILEQVLEHILNKEESQAQDLLHSFFVEKGRNIYESLITSDELAEEEVLETEELVDDEQADFAGDITSAKEEIENEEMFSEDDEEFGDEEGLDGEEEMGDEEGHEEAEAGDEGKIDDAILDVEDALDELKSLFAQLKGEEAGEEEMGGEEEGQEEMGFGGEEEMGESADFDELEESASLIAVPAPKHGDNGNQTKSPVAANSGQKGMAAKPFSMGKGSGETGRTAPSSKEDDQGNVNVPGNKKSPSLSAVAKPAKGEAAGNTRSPIAGR